MSTEQTGSLAKKPWRSQFHERARRETRRAVENGELTRPDKCEKCGVKPKPRKDGKAAIQCHHTDYSKPMEIQWLCSMCHRAVTPVSRHGLGGLPGSKNTQAKLTETAVLEMRQRYSRGVFGYRRLSVAFGVSIPVVKDIINRRAWNHV